MLYRTHLLLLIAMMTRCSLAHSEVPSDVQNHLLNIAKHHEHAHTIWNIVNKYELFNPMNVDEQCLAQLKVDHRLISPVLINTTLEDSATYLGVLLHSRVKPRHLYAVMMDQLLYLKTITQVLTEMNYDVQQELMCSGESNCGCVSKEHLDKYKHQLTMFEQNTSDVREYIIYSQYVDLPIRITISIIGLLLTLVLLVIFSREKLMRTETHVLVVNIGVCNIVILALYTPVQYGHMYGLHYATQVYRFIDPEVLVTSANSLIMLCLNIKRYLDVSRVLKPDISGCRINATARCIVHTAVVWTTSVTLSWMFSPSDHFLLILVKSLLYNFVFLVIFSILVAVFNLMSARLLQRAAQTEQVNSDLRAITSSSVVLWITVAYYAVHIPFFILVLSSIFIPNDPLTHTASPLYRTFELVIFMYFISYPSIVIAVLYKTSSAYRTYFRKYMCRCWYIPDDGEYITMSSLQHALDEA